MSITVVIPWQRTRKLLGSMPADDNTRCKLKVSDLDALKAVLKVKVKPVARPWKSRAKRVPKLRSLEPVFSVKDLDLFKSRNKQLAFEKLRIRNNLRSRLKQAIKSGAGSDALLGCNIDKLRSHLEKQFVSGMSWDNYGSWHIDRIIPLSKVDLKDAQQLVRVCHYSNLQPLWASDNIRKGNKVTPAEIEKLTDPFFYNSFFQDTVRKTEKELEEAKQLKAATKACKIAECLRLKEAKRLEREAKARRLVVTKEREKFLKARAVKRKRAACSARNIEAQIKRKEERIAARKAAKALLKAEEKRRHCFGELESPLHL